MSFYYESALSADGDIISPSCRLDDLGEKLNLLFTVSVWIPWVAYHLLRFKKLVKGAKYGDVADRGSWFRGCLIVGQWYGLLSYGVGFFFGGVM